MFYFWKTKTLAYKVKRRTIKLLILVSSIALAGIIFSQFYWVKQAINLRQEQFDNSVRIAAKSVINQLLDQKNDTVYQEHIRMISCKKMDLCITDFINPVLLDSLLQEELGCMNLNSDYFYGVYSQKSKNFVAGSYKGLKTEIINSRFKFSLSSVYKHGNYQLGIFFPNTTNLVIRNIKAMVLFSAIFTIVLLTSFIIVIHTILKQKRLSEIKTDFINNLTHEFKTPIATTSLAAEMLLKEDVMENPSRVYKYANVVLDESKRLESQVEHILQIASVEKGDLKLKPGKTNIHDLLEGVVDSFELRANKNNVKLTTYFNATHFLLNIDKMHITNVVYNLIDNAIKYSPENPEIIVATRNTRKEIVISVSDNGIGISREFQKDIFKNLFRVPTGNLHDVRGFGLGLYYSKEVVERCRGHIRLKSEFGKGSTFEVYLPLGNSSQSNLL